MLKNFDSSLKNTAKDLLKFKFLSFLLLISVTITKAIVIILLYIIANFINSIIASNKDNIIFYLIILGGLTAASLVFTLIKSLILNNLTKKLQNHISKQIIDHMVLNNLYSWNKVSNASKIAFINQNASAIVQNYHLSFFSFFGSFVAMVSSFVSVGLLLPIALSYVIPLVIVLILGQFLVAKPYQVVGQLSGEVAQKRSKAILITFGNFLMIKRNNYVEKYKKFYGKKLNEIINKENKVAKLISIIILVNVGMSGIFSGLTILATIGIAIQYGDVAFGVVLGIINISFLVFQEGIQTVENIANILQGKGLFDQVCASLVYKEYDKKEINSFESISVKSKNKLSKQLDFTIKKGEKILIEGPNGSGKSSFLEFFSGNFWNENLSLEVNKEDYSNEKVFNLNQLTYLCTNLNYFENKKLEDNLIFNENLQIKTADQNKTILMHKLIDSFKLSNLDLNQEIDDKELTYSEGEKQKIQIIRAILSDKQILIFDESLANIDVETRDVIYKYLLEEEKRTVFIVSHDFDKPKYEKWISQTLNTNDFKVFEENKEIANA